MRENATPAMQCFVGVGLVILAWRFAPGRNSDPMLYLLSGLFAYCGAVMLISGFRRAHPRPSPLPGLAGKVLWALRPRSWMIAWVLICLAAAILGTPHLAFNYPPRLGAGTCEYVGWKGVVRTQGDVGMLNGCKLLSLQ